MNSEYGIARRHRLEWFKSSYSSDEGGACVEVACSWRKSSYSGDEGGECVEVAASPRTVHVRDSKLGAQAPRVDVPAAAWAAFVRFVVGA